MTGELRKCRLPHLVCFNPEAEPEHRVWKTIELNEIVMFLSEPFVIVDSKLTHTRVLTFAGIVWTTLELDSHFLEGDESHSIWEEL